jgi:hypothetical protein
MNTKTAAILLGLVFLVVGILGYVSNPIVGSSAGAIFMTNNLHNIIHIASGVLLLLGAFTGLGSALALRVVGVVYAIVAICGFVIKDDMMFGIAMNMNDRWLHVGLAVIILACGFLLPSE